jgi:hypothetical protein
MHLRDLHPEHVNALEASHYTRWLNTMLSSGNARTAKSSLPETAVAAAPEQLDAAEELVRRRYSWRGYLLKPSDRLVNPPSLSCVTLIAQAGNGLLGTLTVRPDSPEGLLAEHTFPEVIDQLRLDGRRLGELTKLAVEEGADWKAALQALVHSAYVVTRTVHALTDVVIEVNPRHVRFYRRVFGFVAATAERVCTRVGAPSVLMLLDLADFGRRLEQLPAYV